jgi:hypothetical protein
MLAFLLQIGMAVVFNSLNQEWTLLFFGPPCNIHSSIEIVLPEPTKG